MYRPRNKVITTQWQPLTDYQWAAISPFFDLQRKRKHELRTITDAIFWILRTDCQWRNQPPNFPH
ncbi:transposase [Spirosoma flavus]